jgi:hypothetical protein
MTELARHKLVDGFPRFRITIDHLCSACEQGKSTRAHFPSKTEHSMNHVLQLLHMICVARCVFKVSTVNATYL